ncbi:hypothetical protein JCM1840_006187 [Sporobolomyces johnsonii]
MSVPNLAVLLLLGGRSSRMGTPKHLLDHPSSGLPLYQHHLEILRQLQDEGHFEQGVWVSAREDQQDGLQLPEGVHLVLDDPSTNGDIGPASGILQASAHNPSANWLLLAVDLPFVTRSSVLHLLASHAPSSPVSLYLHPEDGNPEPLFSLWTPLALEQLRANCRNGKSGPCRAAKDVWGGRIEEGKGGVKVLEEDWVTDADTPEEWERALRALAAKHEVSLLPLGTTSTPPRISPSPSQSAFAPKRRKIISYSSALDLIHGLPLHPLSPSPSVPPSPSTSESESASHALPLISAVSHVAARPIRALLPHPLHDNSAMDGYALPSSLLLSASPSNPISLPILGRIVAGDPPPSPSAVEDAGTQGCWEIMTGAIFPSEEFDAVVKVEDALQTTVLDERGRKVVRFEAPAKRGQHRRTRGEQVRAGEEIVRAGERITPEKILLLAASGVSSVDVRPSSSLPRPPPRGRVGIISTGKEVIPLSSLPPSPTSSEPLPGQVIDCITPFLSSLLLSRGYEPVPLPCTGDSPTSFTLAVSSGLSAHQPQHDPKPTAVLDLLITTAGVSLGVTDHLPSSLASRGDVETVFHGVAMRPGQPVMLSVHTPTGTPVLSLPGNPMAGAVGMRGFGVELLERLERGRGAGRDAPWVQLERGEGAESEKWDRVVREVREGGSAFFALPVDGEGRPKLPGDERKDGKRGRPCAVGSLVGAEAWVRVDAKEGGEKVVKWCRF